ncbi:MAG: 6-phosphogluconolactonase [Oceanicoccus sp.]|jgi:6-phosphogluconolactonase
MIVEHFFPDRKSLFSSMAEECKSILTNGILENGSATMLVSGGSTPLPLYQKLSGSDLSWSNIKVALVDERWVDDDHPGSNASFIKTSLLQDRAKEAAFVNMKTDDDTAEQGLIQCEEFYKELQTPFDLTILGMGADGHTASLFPYSKGLELALDKKNESICTAIQANQSDVTGELTERMSLTISGLMKSRQLHLLITGEEKLAVYRQALSHSQEELMPISAILHQYEIPVIVYWAP